MTAQLTRPGASRQSWWRRLRGGLNSDLETAITTAITDLVSSCKLVCGVVEELEELLIANEFGVDVAGPALQRAVGEGRYDKMIQCRGGEGNSCGRDREVLFRLQGRWSIDGDQGHS